MGIDNDYSPGVMSIVEFSITFILVGSSSTESVLPPGFSGEASDKTLSGIKKKVCGVQD